MWMGNRNPLDSCFYRYQRLDDVYYTLYHIGGYAMDIVQVTWSQDTGGSPRYMAPECFVVGSCITEKAKKGMYR